MQAQRRAQLRRGSLSDVAAIAEIFGQARAMMVYLPPLHSRGELLTYFARELAEHRCVVVANDQEAVGFVIFDQHFVRHLYVRADHARQGLGSALLEWTKSQSRGQLELWTFQKNLTARRFFERHGLSCVEETDGATNEEQVPDARYVWSGP